MARIQRIRVIRAIRGQISSRVADKFGYCTAEFLFAVHLCGHRVSAVNRVPHLVVAGPRGAVSPICNRQAPGYQAARQADPSFAERNSALQQIGNLRYAQAVVSVDIRYAPREDAVMRVTPTKGLKD